ncbi:MAG: BMP family ABC transporter substrate-binding protein, partial [Bacteroidota bacterium]
ADAANTLIEQGADILLQHTDSPAAMTIAEEQGIYAFGQASDMLEFGPNARLSSIIDNWNFYYIDRVQAVMDGTWESMDTWGGIDSGMTEIGGFSDKIPFEVRKQAMDATVAIASGRFEPFTGPINKQDGTAWLAEGETADIGTLLGMNFYVEGIEGDIPQ